MNSLKKDNKTPQQIDIECNSRMIDRHETMYSDDPQTRIEAQVPRQKNERE